MEHNPSLTLTPQHSEGGEKWAVEPQRNRTNLFLGIKWKKKKLWDLELTFLLSSISCSNMALNTGERAEKRKMQENQEQSRIEKVRWVRWTLSPNYRGAKRSSGSTQAPLKACQETFRGSSWKLATFVYSSGCYLLSQHWSVWHEKSINMWMLCVYLLINIYQKSASIFLWPSMCSSVTWITGCLLPPELFII